MAVTTGDVRRTRRYRPMRVFVLVFVGVLAVQMAWICAFPAFRGIDEHDHVFRADSVAAGEIAPSGNMPEESRGELLSVRRSIIEAAGPVCSALPYTQRYDCNAFAPDGSERALVASAAARYNPAFYWVIGTAASSFEGTNAVYAMRAATAAICALLIALSFLIMQRLDGSRWRLAALLGVLTPTMTYSTAVAAPNGVEMSAALLTWVSLLVLTQRASRSEPLPPWLTASAIAGLCILSTVRTLGPLWAVLIVLASLIAGGRGPKLWSSLRGRRRPIVVIAVVWALAGLAGVAWTLIAGTNDPRTEGTSYDGSPWSQIPGQVVLWVLQSIGAFPTRGEQAPVIVYALFLIATAALISCGVRSSTRQWRLAMLMIVGSVVAVSVALSVATYAAVGFAWQGRYAWPLSMGVPLLAGLAITARARRRMWLVCLTCLVACATAISQVAVLHLTRAKSPTDDWALLPAPALVVLTVVGFASLLLADSFAPPLRREHSPD